MFKSAENLRLAAEMRALQRVAAPWRQSRTSWFDGTPESLEARLGATERVLAHARSGYTAAHLALTTEAENARRELVAARDRLLTDFLDDGARAFRGNRRTAGDGPGPGSVDDLMFPNRRQPTGADYLAEMDPEDRPGYGEGGSDACRHCGERITDRGLGYGHYDGENAIGEPDFYEADHPAEPDDDYHTARRLAAPQTSVGEGGAGIESLIQVPQVGTASTSIPGAAAKMVWNGATMTGQETTPPFNPGPKKAALRVAVAPVTLPDFDDQLLFGG